MNNGKIKVIHLIGNAELGGVANCVMNYYRNIDREKFEFDFITYGASSVDEEIRELGGRVFYVKDFRLFPVAMKQLKKILTENRYDVFHSHLTALSVFPLYIAKQCGVGVRICHSHSTTDGKEATSIVKNFLKKHASRYATHLFACSEYSAEWLYGEGANVFIMPNAVDKDRYAFDGGKRLQTRKDCILDGSLAVGFAGRFEYQKNLRFFLDAAACLDKKTPTVAVLVGDGSEKEKLKKYSEKKNIRCLFVTPSLDMARWYSTFDCLCMPSRYEGLPLVAVEAQYNGLRCYLSDTVTKETDLGNAVFLPAVDPEEWAEKIFSERKIHRSDKAIVNEEFDIKNAVKKLENEYLNIISEAK